MLNKYLRNLLDTLLFSNVFIAMCAVAQAMLTYRVLAIPVNGRVLLILGCATLALYNFSMILARPQDPAASPYRRVRWVFRHERSLWGWTGVALLLLSVLGTGLHLLSFALLALMGLMGLAYNLPFIRIAGSPRLTGLRQITGIKLFYIGMMWAMSVVLLPVAEAYQNGFPVAWAAALKWMTCVLMFVVAITIPFDVRDIYQDRHYGLKTIPILIGERKAHALAASLLLVHAAWTGLSDYPAGIRLGLSGISLLCLACIVFPLARKNEYYYFLLLDGMLMLQFLAVYALSPATGP